MPPSRTKPPSEIQIGDKKIPKAVIKRLSLYSRVLQGLEFEDRDKVSSRERAISLGLNSAQVRKDLAYFGQFGVPGLGYYVSDLRTNIKHILGTDRTVRLGLVGVGNLGAALLAYGGFSRQGFEIVAAFDSDKRKVGSQRNSIPVHDVTDMQRKIRDLHIEIIVLAVPAEIAQQVCDQVVGAGVAAVLNFVPTHLKVPDGVKVHYVDLSIEIESLTYYLR